MNLFCPPQNKRARRRRRKSCRPVCPQGHSNWKHNDFLVFRRSCGPQCPWGHSNWKQKIVSRNWKKTRIAKLENKNVSQNWKKSYRKTGKNSYRETGKEKFCPPRVVQSPAGEFGFGGSKGEFLPYAALCSPNGCVPQSQKALRCVGTFVVSISLYFRSRIEAEHPKASDCTTQCADGVVQSPAGGLHNPVRRWRYAIHVT